MFHIVLYCAAALLVVDGMPAGETMVSEDEALAILQQYGYAGQENPDPRIAELISEDPSMALQTGLSMFQQRYGLEVTGTLNEETHQLLTSSRCGNKDIVVMDDMFDMDTSGSAGRRRKRFAAEGNPWPNNNIRYIVTRYPQDGDLSNSVVDSELARAFQVWADVTPLTFTRVSSASNAEMVIQFASGDHGDGNAFDGRGRVLAHAYLPFNHRGIEGDTHFDDDEIWTSFTYDGTNLFLVAAHEFGHALGLGHSDVRGALMYPYYGGYIPDFSLPSDDIMGIQSLYGAPDNGNGDGDGDGMGGNGGGNPVTFPQGVPDLCRDSSIDAITYIIRNNQAALAVFKDNYYALIDSNGVASGFPRLISDDFAGISGQIDAALYLEPVEGSGYWRFDYEAWEWRWVVERSPASTLLFQDSSYYVVGDDGRVTGGRRPSSELGMPADIDAAFVWARNNKIYVTKESNYYRYTRQTTGSTALTADSGYPRALSVWNLPESSVDAAIKAGQNNYFIKDDQLYLYDNNNVQVATGYPRSMSLVFGCSGNLEEDTSTVNPMLNGHNNDGESNAADTQTVSYVTFMSLSCLTVLFAL